MPWNRVPHFPAFQGNQRASERAWQLMSDRGVKKDQLPAQSKLTEHDALGDAKWIRDAYLYIRGNLEEVDAQHKAGE